MNFSSSEIALLVVSLFNLGIGFFVWVKQQKRIVNRAFCAATSGISVWGIGLIFLAHTHNFAWNTVMFYGFTLFLFGFVLFARVFPSGPSISKKFYLLFVPLVFTLIAAPLGLIVKDAIYHPGGQTQPVNGPLFGVFAVISLGYFIFGLYLFIRTYIRSRGIARQQVNYFLFGLGILIICTIIFDMILPAFGIFKLNFMGPLSSIVLSGLTAYAIIRHQLMDVRIVIQRGLIYTILLALIAGMYVLAIQLLAYALHEVTNLGTIISAAITMLIGICFARPLENYFRKITDPIFFKHAYDYAEAMHALSRVLYSSLDQDAILRESKLGFEKIFKTPDVQFVLEPEAVGHLTEDEQCVGSETLSYAIIFDDKPVGVLRFGKKRSGDIYTQMDQKLIATFAWQFAIALGKARLHEEVRQYSSHLEEQVEARTAEIKKLQEDQKQAMIEISHNLQTPLAVIQAKIELLESGTYDQSGVSVVKESLERVSYFIRQMLHLARLESSLYQFNFASVDLADIVRDQAEYFQVMAADRGVQVDAHVPVHAMITGDRKLLGELISNLIMNAVAYKRSDVESKVTIAVIDELDAIRLTVSDNGIGIAAEDQSKIFTRFYRAENISPSLKGTGLGLAIVKEIIERHKGSIRVESILGEGTQFTVTFPKIKH